MVDVVDVVDVGIPAQQTASASGREKKQNVRGFTGLTRREKKNNSDFQKKKGPNTRLIPFSNGLLLRL